MELPEGEKIVADLASRWIALNEPGNISRQAGLIIPVQLVL
jgi:hypothetical protein